MRAKLGADDLAVEGPEPLPLPRPDGLALNPAFAELIDGMGPTEKSLLSTAVAWRLLPESYLYGLAAVLRGGESYHSYALGTIYPHRVWFYFPLAFSIKTTLGFLGLIVLSVIAIILGRMGRAREALFLIIPPVFYFLFAMASGMYAGQTAHDALNAGDVSESGLAGYRRSLEQSFVLKDHRKLRDIPHLVLSDRVQQRYPSLATNVVERMFRVDNPEPKPGLRRILKEERKRAGVRMRDLARDTWTALRGFG